MTSKDHKIRYAKRRNVLVGYPVIVPFKTIAEVDEYIGQPTIICLLCGKEFNSLNGHLAIHDITSDEYKEKYNIPWGRGLQSKSTKDKSSKSGHETYQANKEFYDGVFIKNRGNNGGKMRQNSLITDQSKERIDKVNLSGINKGDSYKEDLGLIIIEHIINGHHIGSLRDIDEQIPSSSTIRKWLRNYPNFKNELYNRIKKDGSAKTRGEFNILPDNLDKLAITKFNEWVSPIEIAALYGVSAPTIRGYVKHLVNDREKRILALLETHGPKSNKEIANQLQATCLKQVSNHMCSLMKSKKVFKVKQKYQIKLSTEEK